MIKVIFSPVSGCYLSSTPDFQFLVCLQVGDQLVEVDYVDVRNLKPAQIGNLLLGEEVVMLTTFESILRLSCMIIPLPARQMTRSSNTVFLLYKQGTKVRLGFARDGPDVSFGFESCARVIRNDNCIPFV